MSQFLGSAALMRSFERQIQPVNPTPPPSSSGLSPSSGSGGSNSSQDNTGSGGSYIDVAPSPMPGPIDTSKSSQDCPDCGTNAGSYVPAGGTIVNGFLKGNYQFEVGGKNYSVSKKIVWGTVAGAGGIALLIAYIR